MTLAEKTSALNAWHRADLIFKHLQQVVPNFMSPKTILIQPFTIYADLFYALLFTVIEFLKEKDSIPLSVASEVNSHWDSLRLFRNAVFHIQDVVVSHKTMALVESGLDLKTVLRIHREVGVHLEGLTTTG